MAQTTEFSIDSFVLGLADDHPVALEARDDLLTDLSSEPVLRVAERERPGGTGKGAATELLVALGSSGSIAAFVRLARLWLERDRNRSLTVTVRDGDGERVVRVEGEKVSVAALTAALGLPVPPTAPTDESGLDAEKSGASPAAE